MAGQTKSIAALLRSIGDVTAGVFGAHVPLSGPSVGADATKFTYTAPSACRMPRQRKVAPAAERDVVALSYPAEEDIIVHRYNIRLAADSQMCAQHTRMNNYVSPYKESIVSASQPMASGSQTPSHVVLHGQLEVPVGPMFPPANQSSPMLSPASQPGAMFAPSPQMTQMTPGVPGYLNPLSSSPLNLQNSHMNLGTRHPFMGISTDRQAAVDNWRSMKHADAARRALADVGMYPSNFEQMEADWRNKMRVEAMWNKIRDMSRPQAYNPMYDPALGYDGGLGFDPDDDYGDGAVDTPPIGQYAPSDFTDADPQQTIM